ncbi:MAG: ABC transporter permease [Candidatus Binatia bacterium]
MNQLASALFISRKDVESYYGKPPLITWGILFPAVLMLAIYVKDPTTYLNVAPGIIAMTWLFGNTSMAAIVVTWEKRSGTLQRLLLTPVTHRTIVLGKAVSAAVYGIATSLVISIGLVLLLGMPVVNPLAFCVGLLFGAGAFSLLGLIVSVMVREVFEAMTLMNFLRFPILFISGVFMPIEALPSWVKPIALASPLTYVVELLRFGISGRSYFSSPWICALGAAGFLALSWLVAGPAFQRNANQ